MEVEKPYTVKELVSKLKMFEPEKLVVVEGHGFVRKVSDGKIDYGTKTLPVVKIEDI